MRPGSLCTGGPKSHQRELWGFTGEQPSYVVPEINLGSSLAVFRHEPARVLLLYYGSGSFVLVLLCFACETEDAADTALVFRGSASLQGSENRRLFEVAPLALTSSC